MHSETVAKGRFTASQVTASQLKELLDVLNTYLEILGDNQVQWSKSNMHHHVMDIFYFTVIHCIIKRK